MKKLDPIWDKGEYPIEKINPDAGNIDRILGISKERELEIQIAAIKSILEYKKIDEAMMKVSEICVHPNELAYANYIIGTETTLIKLMGKAYEKKMEKSIKDMEAELIGEDNQEKSLDDVDLNFPEEKEESLVKDVVIMETKIK